MIVESNIFFQLLIIFLLTGMNAFFSGAEMAIISVNKNRVKFLVDEGNKKAILLEKLLEEPSKFLSTIQVGITLTGFFASASAATGLSKYLTIFFEKFNFIYSYEISMILITLLLSYITLVFGELLPKRIALKSSEKIALSSVGIIWIISKIFSPFIKLLIFSTNMVLKVLKKEENNIDERVSKEEIKSLVEVGREHGIINDIEKEMIENVIEFDEKVAREIMIPRTKVFLVEKNIDIQELFENKEILKYSRIPVYENAPDNIIGLLHTKDLMIEAFRIGFKNIKISQILQEGYYVPETKNVNELFNELQKEKKHMAILIDEYGGFSGIVTLEDMIEEVMGNIFDEFDDEDLSIKKIGINKYLVSGAMSLNDINDYFNISLESRYYDTLSGLLIEKLGYIPMDNEKINSVKVDNIIFKPKRVKNKKIEKILIEFNYN